MKLNFLLLLFLFSIASVIAQEQFSIYFESNKYEFTHRESQRLSLWINENPMIKVLGIHGFCDEDGSFGFNDTLAKKRINFVYNAIKDKVNIREDFKTRSFGELHSNSKIKSSL